jgi:hypothetical protein
MASELMEALKALAREKNIDDVEMLDRLESALAATYVKILDLENDAKVTLDTSASSSSSRSAAPRRSPSSRRRT